MRSNSPTAIGRLGRQSDPAARRRPAKAAICLVLAAMWTLSACRSGEAQPQTSRFGVGVPPQNMVDGQVTTDLNLFEGYKPGDQPWNPLGIGWYFNWHWIQLHGAVCDPVTGECIEYMPLVGGWNPGVSPSIATIRDRVNANPSLYPNGMTWLIGNEIIWDDRRTPLQYAKDYHDFYHGLKGINPTFKVAIGSVITSVYYNKTGFTGTPYELLNAIRAAYQSEYGVPMPVDVWNIHPYVWKKSSVQLELDDFRTQLNQFRDWMKSVGEQDKPLIITEYGLLEYHEEQWMIDYLLGSFEILLSKGYATGMPSDEGRLVQRWAWFANNNAIYGPGGKVEWTNCALYNGDTFDMRPLGRAYANHPKEPNVTSIVVSSGISSNLLVADDQTQYTVSVTAEDGNGIKDIRDIRIIFYTGGAWESANGRGYLVWGQNDYDIEHFGGSWAAIADAAGGGRWSWNNADWGSNTYITPISACTTTSGNRRTVTFAFTAKAAWAPAGGQKLRAFVHDGGNKNSGWVEPPVSYAVASSLDMGAVHNNPDGTSVQIPCAIATAGNDQLSSTFYVQALDRSHGIKVYGGTANVQAGNLVTISGKIQTQVGERMITYPVVTILAAGFPLPKPLYLSCRDLGGDSPNAYTQPVYQSFGLYNVGLLITICGRVTHSDATAKFFYVDDGSGRDDGSGYAGVRVSCSALASGNTIAIPAQDSYVKVTGISAAKTSSGKVISIIRPRTSADIVVF